MVTERQGIRRASWRRVGDVLFGGTLRGATWRIVLLALCGVLLALLAGVRIVVT